MAQWGNKDQEDNAPKFVTNATTGETGIDEYGNTVFGYDTSEVEVDEGLASPGWVRVRKGEGSITGFTIVDGGLGYANGDLVIAGDEEGEIVTDEDGVITEITYTPSGDKIEEIPEVTFDTESGEDAVITLVAEGPIGRIWSETLVAMRNIS